jgi:hypothetical protein
MMRLKWHCQQTSASRVLTSQNAVKPVEILQTFREEHVASIFSVSAGALLSLKILHNHEVYAVFYETFLQMQRWSVTANMHLP